MKFHILIIAMLITAPLIMESLTAVTSAPILNNMRQKVMDNLLWNPTVELTWLGDAKNPSFAWENGTYNLVWQDNRNGNWDIYYLRLTPYGFKLVNDTRVTKYAGNDTKPSIAVRGDYIFLVWQRFIDKHWAIYFSKLEYSNKNISIVIPPKPIENVPYNATNPQIAVDSQGFIHVVWQEFRDKWEIMYDKLDSSGNPVFSPILVSAMGNSMRPAIAVTPKNSVEITWVTKQTTPGYGLMYRGLDCCGYGMTPIRRVSIVSPTTEARISYDKDIQIVFSDTRENKSSEIIYTELNDTGITIVDDTNLTAIDGINSSAPSMLSMGNRMFVVWQDSPGIIKFSEFNMQGRRLVRSITISGNNSSNPQVAVGTNTLAVSWVKKIGNRTYLMMRSALIPDLRPYSIMTEQHKNMVNISVAIEDSPSMSIYAPYSLYVDNIQERSGIILVNGTTIANFDLYLKGGDHTIKFVINPNRSIYERNTDNDEISTTIFVKIPSFEVEMERDYYMNATGGNISIEIINTGNVNDSYDVSAINVSSMLTLDKKNKKLSLGPGELGIINFTVKPKIDISVGNYSIAFNITSGSGLWNTTTVGIHILPKIMFSVHYMPVIYAEPGKKASISIGINNLGNCNTSFLINFGTTAPWPVEYANETMNLGIGKSGYFTMEITVPPDTPAFSKDMIFGVIRTKPENFTENFSIAIITAAVHNAEVNIISEEEIDGAYNITLMIVNTGNIADLFSFSIIGDLANYATLSESSELIPVGGHVNVTIIVNIPHNTSAGSHSLTFMASVGNQSVASKIITLTVPPVYGYSASVRSTSTKILNVKLVINNTGNAIETVFIKPKMNRNITLIISMDGKEFKNETYAVLHPGEQKIITITTTSKLPSGEYKMTVFLSSPTGENMTLTTDVHIGPKNTGILGLIMDNLLYIAIGVAVAVIAVVYLLRKE